MKNKQVIFTGVFQFLLTVIASILIGSEFGWKIGVAVGFIVWTITPIQEG